MIKSFGFMPDGREVYEVWLSKKEIRAKIITYGATLNSLVVTDREGNPLDIVLGFDNLEDYISQDKCFGCIVGRCTNRISNARFSLNGTVYNLYKNKAGNSSHGGKIGFGKKVWDIKEYIDNSVTLSLFSPDMEENYPGDLQVEVTYTLLEDRLKLEYRGVTSKDTIINLTNHAYFNIDGHNAGNIKDQLISINADSFVWADNKTVPDGRIIPVEGTPMDLRQLQPFSKSIDSDYDQIRWGKGYDRNWCINGKVGSLNYACHIEGVKSGICLDVYTTQPGLQVYTGNFLGGVGVGKENTTYIDRGAYALEAQGYPDAINHPNFPSVVLKAGEEYRETTEYRFGFAKDLQK